MVVHCGSLFTKSCLTAPSRPWHHFCFWTTRRTVVSDGRGDSTKWLDRTSFFRVRCTSFHIHSLLLTFFLWFIILFQSCCSLALVWENTCKSSPFSIAILKRTCSLRSTILFLWWRACFKKLNYKQTKLLLLPCNKKAQLMGAHAVVALYEDDFHSLPTIFFFYSLHVYWEMLCKHCNNHNYFIKVDDYEKLYMRNYISTIVNVGSSSFWCR